MTAPKSPVELSVDFNTNLDAILTYVKEPITDKIKDFFDTPSFKKYFGSKKINELVPFYTAVNYINNIAFVNQVWNDVPIDFFQTHERILEVFELYNCVKTQVRSWMQEQMTYATFLHMVQTYYDKEGMQKTDNMIADTFKQCCTLIDRKETITRPRRWRLEEFHDHMSHLYIVSTTTNKEHKKEFIPLPIEKNSYKIYEPKDTLELTLWGKKVRNCVASYEDKILGERSAIFLIEKENKPTYTFELDYNALKKGQVQVKQCVGVGNSSIPVDERKEVEELISSVVK